MSQTAIEWTQQTWNPTVGCDRISPGCANCYAKTLHDKRHKAYLAGKKMPPQYGQPFEAMQLMDRRLDAPLRRRHPTTYFVNSVSDLFHESVPVEYIDRVFAVMALAAQHTFQVLTKRADRMRDYLNDPYRKMEVARHIHARVGDEAARQVVGGWQWPLKNVWLGISGENRRFLFERARELVKTPAAVRFFSLEPLLEDVADELRTWLVTRQIHWVIVGGESGPGARPFDVAWARAIVAQCKAAGVPVFVKQIGAFPVSEREVGTAKGSSHVPLKLHDRKGGDPAEWPEDVRVREMPVAR